MDQLIPKILRFDRFALDLTRGCLRSGGSDIDLRPKTFDVLRYLAENGGRLVSKNELLEAVWPDVTVSEDSLVQCIRELRGKLADDEHRLIKTMPRRGYLLDARVTEDPAGPDARDLASAREAPPMPEALRRVPEALRAARWPLWSAIAAIVLAVALAAYPSIQSWRSPPANELFTPEDARRVAIIANDKALPLPAFRISKIERDIPPQFRRFVGVWVSDAGFINSKRQFMLIVTSVEKPGIVTGMTVRGPRQALSIVMAPAGSSRFKARVSGDSFTYSGSTGEHEVLLTAANRLEYLEAFSGGGTARVVLDPVWTLVDAERFAAMQVSAR